MKKPISATIDEDLVAWIDKELKRDGTYRNRSHIIETALNAMKKRSR